MKKYIKVVAINAGVLAVLALVLLLVMRALDRHYYRALPDPEKSYSRRMTTDDDDLGYKGIPGAAARATLRFGNKLLYDVVYSHDAYGHRIVPMQKTCRRQRAVLFFGCSVTYGEGVNDNETLPYYLSRRMPLCTMYNYAYLGYGTQQMLARLESGNLRKEVRESDAALVYVFDDDHVRRNVGTMLFTFSWGRNTPYYTMDGRGHLTRKGSFATGRRFTTLVYETLGKIDYIRHCGWRRPMDFPALGDKHVYFTARMIRQSRDEFARQFKNGRFCVLLYPGSRFAGRLVPLLKSAGITCLDYSGDERFKGDAYRIAGDGHPTAYANGQLADMLALDLERLAE